MRKYQTDLHLIIRLKLDNYIFKDNYNIVRNRFETDSVSAMKNRSLVAKKQRKFQYILAWLSLLENHENCTQQLNNSTQIVRKPCVFFTNS